MVKRKGYVSLIAVAALVGVVGCGSEPADVGEPQSMPEPMPAAAAAPTSAVAELTGAEGTEVMGTITFVEDENGVTIVAELSGVEPGLHGFHLHETGDCSAADFASAGGHFNPYEMPHAGPDAEERHAGDLGNIEIGEDGMGRMETTSDLVTVGEGPASVVGRTVVLHAGEDDMASQPSGAAGSRIGCGVITLPGEVSTMDFEGAEGVGDNEEEAVEDDGDEEAGDSES